MAHVDRHRRRRLGADADGPPHRAVRDRSSWSSVITDALAPLGPHPGRRRLHLPRQLRLHHRPGVLVRPEPRRHRRLAAQAGLPRRDGRRLGAVRSLAAAAAGRHRDRRRDRLGPVVDRGPGADLPDGDGPVLPRPARCRPAHLRRPAGPGGDRGRHRRRAFDGRGVGAVAGGRAPSTSCWRGTTCASPCAATTSRRSPTGPPPWSWPPATGPASWSSARPTSPASTTAASATTRRSGTSTTRRPRVSQPRPPGWATVRSRWPSCRPPSPTRSCCCAGSSTSVTTWP